MIDTESNQMQWGFARELPNKAAEIVKETMVIAESVLELRNKELIKIVKNNQKGVG